MLVGYGILPPIVWFIWSLRVVTSLNDASFGLSLSAVGLVSRGSALSCKEFGKWEPQEFANIMAPCSQYSYSKYPRP